MTQQAAPAALFAGLLKGKKGLILGVANNRSIAWGIAKACADAGADLALTYQIEALEKRVRPLAADIGATVVGRCDVSEPETMDAVFAEIEKLWGRLDFVVHCLAYSDKDQLDGRYVETTLENFQMSLNISCYSFTAIAQRAEKLMTDGGSLLTLTYYGAEKWMPHYNVMGVAKAALEASVRYLAADLGVKNIRVNAISAGPIKTMAASGIGDFRYILRWNEYNSPLRRVVTIEEVGETAVYLLSPMARGVSGEVLHVDAGYHVVGMMNRAPRRKWRISWRCCRSRSERDAFGRCHIPRSFAVDFSSACVRVSFLIHHFSRDGRRLGSYPAPLLALDCRSRTCPGMVDRIADRRPPHHWPRYSEDAIWLADWSSMCRPLSGRLWEIRTSLPSKREARVLFGFHDNELIALHAFIKKTPSGRSMAL